jgi:hypothetical protein
LTAHCGGRVSIPGTVMNPRVVLVAMIMRRGGFRT